MRLRSRGRFAMMGRYSALKVDLISRVRRVSRQAIINPSTPSIRCRPKKVSTSSTSSCSQRHLSEMIDSMGRESTLRKYGRVSVRAVIFGDKNARIDETASQFKPSTNLNEVSLGQRGSSVDCIPKKEYVSEDTAVLWNPPMNSSTTRAAYPLNRCHSFVVGALTKC